MSIWLLVTFGLVVIGTSVRCMQRALIDGVRQDLYRIREKIHDRAFEGEFSLDDKSIARFVRFLHTLIYALENWTIVDILDRIFRTAPDSLQPEWIGDERIRYEASGAIRAAIRGLAYVSLLVRIVLSILWVVARVAPPFVMWHHWIKSRIALAFDTPHDLQIT